MGSPAAQGTPGLGAGSVIDSQPSAKEPAPNPERAREVSEPPTYSPEAPRYRAEFCEACEAEYAVWFAPSDVWNAVMRRGQGELYSFICPTCFTNLADRDSGVTAAGWLVTPFNAGPVRFAHDIVLVSTTATASAVASEKKPWPSGLEEAPTGEET